MTLYTNFIPQDRLAEYQLFLLLIRAGLSQEQMHKSAFLVHRPDIDWLFISRLAEQHRVLPILYANIKKMNLQAHVPSDLLQHLARIYLRVVGNNLRLVARLLAVLKIFEQRGIPAVAVKGPVLAQSMYGDSTLRYCQDLDILVPGNRAVEARSALLEAGYCAYKANVSGRQFAQILRHGREFEFFEPTGRILIDLHWQLSPPFGRVYDYEFCQARLQKIQLHNQQVSALSWEDTLLHLCLNGTHDVWHDVDKILCVAEYIAQHPNLNWEKVQGLARELHCQRALRMGLFLARDIFGAAIPPEMAGQIEKDKSVQKLAENIFSELFQGHAYHSYIEKRVAQLPYYLKMRENIFDKLSYLLRRIFVPTMKDWQNSQISPRFSFLLFIRRPVAMAMELLRAKAK